MELEFIDISRPEDGTKTRRITSAHKSGENQKSISGKGERRRQISQKERLQRKKRRRRKLILMRTAILTIMFLCIFLFCGLLYMIIRGVAGYGILADVFNEENKSEERTVFTQMSEIEKPFITEDFLTINPYSRPGDKLKEVNNIFVHYTANRGTSAKQNRSYFENLGATGETSASAHFIIGYDGEIIQCIPLEEIGYAVKQRNEDSISIECCYLDEDGEFTEETYQSLIELSAWLLNEYDLTPEDMMRHYDEGGKKCPLYYVEHEDAWQQFLKDLSQYIEEA